MDKKKCVGKGYVFVPRRVFISFYTIWKGSMVQLPLVLVYHGPVSNKSPPNLGVAIDHHASKDSFDLRALELEAAWDLEL